MLERVLTRDRLVTSAGLAGVTLLAWGYVLSGAGMEMVPAPGETGGAGMAIRPDWTAGYAALMLVMWWVMMVAMMLPSAAPMILVYAALARRRRGQGGAAVAAGVFTSGYLLAWAGFSVVAVTLQWALGEVRLLSPAMASTSLWLGAGLLIAAGVYQLTPLKHACLHHCRSPLWFLSHHWRKGAAGALAMGVKHGLYCLGCCWVLMGLLFYGGVMNLWWVAGLALYVLIEKVASLGGRISDLTGLLLIVWGVGTAALAVV